jgi:hypothetical protein
MRRIYCKPMRDGDFAARRRCSSSSARPGSRSMGSVTVTNRCSPLAAAAKPLGRATVVEEPAMPGPGLSVAGCFLDELYAGGESEFGVDVGEVGLHGAR